MNAVAGNVVDVAHHDPAERSIALLNCITNDALIAFDVQFDTSCKSIFAAVEVVASTDDMVPYYRQEGTAEHVEMRRARGVGVSCGTLGGNTLFLP